MPEIHSAVVEYIHVLIDSRDTTTFSRDRAVYDQHLASAARLVALLAGDDHTVLREWFEREERAFGWSYLSGDQGEQAERAFVALKSDLAVA